MTWTRLHDACQHHNHRLILSLTQYFSEEAMMVDDHGSTPLHIACWGNPPLEVVQALLMSCPLAATDKDAFGNTPLHVATAHPNTAPAVVREILSVCPTAASIVNKEGLMPLHMACRYAPSNEAVISALIDAYPYALKARTKVSAWNTT
jgi:ankyrin repeat protein